MFGMFCRKIVVLLLWSGLCTISAISLSACGDPGTNTPTQCNKNIDCAGSQVCRNGSCVQASQEHKPSERSGTERKAESQREVPSDVAKERDGTDAGTTEQAPEDKTESRDDVPDLTPSGECKSGDTRPCYSGTPGTEATQPCQSGKQRCIGGFWDAECVGEVVPANEVCNGKDDDCNGKTDEADPELAAPCRIKGAKGPCANGKKRCDKGKLICKSEFTKQPKEICDNKLDDDCDGLPDGPPCKCRSGEKRECASPNNPKKGLCRAGQQTCVKSEWGPCVGEIGPTIEVCDSKDNDCDGQVDENFVQEGQACTDSSVKGLCQQGKRVCTQGQVLCRSTTSPVPEVCGDNKDNDCDGNTDEGCQCKPSEKRSCYSGASSTPRLPCKAGTKTCDSKGQWGPCVGEVTPQKEICDNKDNNCDGKIDDNVQRVCSNKCGKGTEACVAGKWGKCNARTPATEVCNGKDDNCDGKIDESLTQSCSNGCGAGTESCNLGKWINCTAPKAVAEICDNKDNDCDGKIDENPPCACRHTTTRSCYTGPTGQDKAPCKRGTQTCNLGKWGSCIGQILPNPEVCDGKDNDCDGKIDDGISCQCTNGSSRACYTASVGCTKSGSGYTCKSPCKSGTQKCSNGKWQACIGQLSPQTEICDSKDNNCDGKIDESDPSNGNACSTGKLGVCKGGTIICSAGKKICKQSVASSIEVCDGKDNNCDGKIDETDPKLNKACTYTKGTGSCRSGRYACSGGRLFCRQTVFPVTERCRDRIDNDCDGKTDEICGASHRYVVFDSKAKVLRANSLNTKYNKTGIYNVFTNSKLVPGCDKRPGFVMATSLLMRPTSVACDNNAYTVYMGSSGATSTKHSDVGGQIVLPSNEKYAVYGSINGGRCTIFGCSVSQLYSSYGTTTPKLKVKRIKAGIYLLEHPMFNSSKQIIFTQIVNDGVAGYASAISLGNGKAYVYTYDLKGAYADRRFSFWAPSLTDSSWAYVNSKGGLIASNNYKDQFAKWNATPKKDSRGDLTNVSFPAWANPSAVIVGVRGSTSFAVTGYSPDKKTFNLYSYTASTQRRQLAFYYVLMVQ